MIDKLSLTTFKVPDKEYLENHGKITEDRFRTQIYKYMCELDKAVVFYYPHKYSDTRNANIPFTKIDINPKDFECYEYMLAYILDIFGYSNINPKDFNVSRIDIAVDIEDFPIDAVLSTLRINKVRSDSLSFYKGTIYIGSDPKIRIYNKTKEIKDRLKKKKRIVGYEKRILKSSKDYTRFEIQIRNVKKTLQEISDNPEALASYYNRLEFFDFQGKNNSGVLQILYKYINRKFRKDLEKYKNHKLSAEIKQKYKVSVSEWFTYKEPF